MKTNTSSELSADKIPEYAKIKEKENPLESIVEKFESRGYTPEQAFEEFNEDCDEVLTCEEIKEGLRVNKIPLTKEEENRLF